MAFKKADPAFRSGMRGSENPEVADRSAAAAEEPSREGEMEIGDLVAEHVHTDEKGEHHLNLSSLGEAMRKKSGLHEE